MGSKGNFALLAEGKEFRFDPIFHFLHLPGLAVALLLLVGGPGMARAEDGTAVANDAASQASRDFLLGNSLFVVLHEFGHVLIRDFDLPILGLEENSADTIASMVMLLSERERSDQPHGLKDYVAMAALANVLIWRTGVEQEQMEIIYWAQHDVSVRRAMRDVCLLYGSDTAEWGWLVDAVEMPEERRDVCEDEFEMARRAVIWVGETYGQPAADNPDLERTEIQVKYSQPRNETQARLLAVVREVRLFEIVAGFFHDRFILKDSMALRVRSCGGPNAYWDDEYRELIFCLEMLEGLEKIGNTPQVQRLWEEFAAARD